MIPLLRAALAGLALLAASPLPAQAQEQAQWRDVEVAATPISFTPRLDDIGTRYGLLTYEGGLLLTSPEPMFGGFSGLDLQDDGTLATAISDDGQLMRFRLETAQHTLRGIGSAAMAPLTGEDGQPLGNKDNRDAEAISLSPDGRSALVGFERTPRLWRYRVDETGLLHSPRTIPLPSAIRAASFNRGIEGVLILAHGKHAGSQLAFLEEPRQTFGQRQGWLLTPQGHQGFSVPHSLPYGITDIAEDSRGRIYVLERHYVPIRGPRIRIRRFNLDHLLAGYGVGEVLLETGLEKVIDNFEALAIHETSQKIFLTLMSDDNFSALQRTLLMRFSVGK